MHYRGVVSSSSGGSQICPRHISWKYLTQFQYQAWQLDFDLYPFFPDCHRGCKLAYTKAKSRFSLTTSVLPLAIPPSALYWTGWIILKWLRLIILKKAVLVLDDFLVGFCFLLVNLYAGRKKFNYLAENKYCSPVTASFHLSFLLLFYGRSENTKVGTQDSF